MPTRARFAWLLLLAILSITLYLLIEPTQRDVERALVDQGFTNVHVTGRRLLACGRDPYGFGFMAINPTTHLPVQGVVCSGYLKGYYVTY